jgi:hypothetical protein
METNSDRAAETSLTIIRANFRVFFDFRSAKAFGTVFVIASHDTSRAERGHKMPEKADGARILNNL